ncbi:hypothetical protein [Paenibacillus sp. PK3_47]|uniref:hypothetical protein n=1 Tax=Paenibacillus sp. PK3_47 TaxID=2072642 RepID=UPI00201E1A1C|nr:hypothetical protein [Paenibacillus sp. PK3_47]
MNHQFLKTQISNIGGIHERKIHLQKAGIAAPALGGIIAPDGDSATRSCGGGYDE